MSLYGEWLAATITAGTSSDEVDLGRDYDFLEIQIPTMTSGTIKLKVAEKTGGTFRDLGDSITTGVGTHNYHDTFKLGGYQFIKVVSSVTQSGTISIRVRGMRY